MAGKINLQKSLQKPYERRLFISEVLIPVFQNRLEVLSSPINETSNLSDGEAKLIKTVLRYGNIILDDQTNITCYEITLHNSVRLEQNKISIQHYVRKLIISGEAMLVNFITDNVIWRFSLVASDTKMMDTGEIKDLKTNAKRYTYLLGTTETCLTAATQLAILEGKPYIERKDLVDAFSVEKVSKPFFDEYTKIHYKHFNDFLINSNYKISVFKGDEKAIRDFVKKLLGRIVFLYFVQKKGWLGENPDFMMSLFKTSGGNDAFYPLWLSKLFFDTLNAPRPKDSFEMPDKTVVKIPFLNGGLFEKDKYDERILTFPPLMFHNPENPDVDKERGFLDFLNAYNFTVYEDSPDDHTVAVDPEMLGHIFENLLEDNKDKGAFYTPKEIVHYMCQESLIDYLCTPETSSSIGKIEMGKTQTDMFGNESRKGQLSLETPVQDTHITPERDVSFKNSVENLIKNQEVSTDLLKNLTYLNARLDAVRICDPAIGSGAFPMGLLHEIFNAKILIMNALNGISPTPAERVEIKLHIIQNSIYGVDIEKGAVDIARLRFWLSLIVDEQKPKALPNLDYKIVVGNSLVSKFEDEVISIDWEIKEEGIQSNIFGSANNVEKRQDLLKEISKKQHDFFIPENHNKKSIALKIKNLKIDLLINQLELMIKDKHQTDEPKVTSYKTKALFMKAQELYFQTLGWQQNIQKLKRIKENPTATLNFFDWKLDFPEILNSALVGNQAGFDIVIGNPPYFNIQTLGAKSSYVEQIKAKYAEIWMDKSDILFYFINEGIELAKKNSNVYYIISNAFLFSDKAQRLRNYILQKAPIQRIINFEKYLVFDSAMITTAIVQFGKSKNNTLIEALTLKNPKENFGLVVKDASNFVKVELKPNNVFALVNDETDKLNAKIDKDKIPLGELVLVGKGMETAANEVFSNSEIINQDFGNEFLKKRLNGKAIKKYQIDNSYTDDMLYFENVDSFENLPKNVQQYLHIHKDILENRATVKNEGRVWWRYSRPMHKDYYHLDKIWTSYRGANNCFAFDDAGFHIGLTNTTVIFDTNSEVISLKYILALLNSNLLNYRYKSIGKQTGGGIFEYFENGISKFPIPKILPEAQKPFEHLVNQILTKKQLGESTAALELEIDRLVYKLYDLTEAEIGVIEGK